MLRGKKRKGWKNKNLGKNIRKRGASPTEAESTQVGLDLHFNNHGKIASKGMGEVRISGARRKGALRKTGRKL